MHAVFSYHVAPDETEAFEAAYGPGGEWARLFAGADGYVGTDLLRSDGDPARYIVIDTWRTEDAYDAFLTGHGRAYDQLCSRTAALFRRETSHGRFETVAARDRPELTLLPGELSVCRLPAGAPVPEWADGSGLRSVTRTPVELSVVCPSASVPEDVQAEHGWRALEVAGPLDFGLTGVLAALTAPLAAAGVPVFALATYDTDYVLVPAAELGAALDALSSAGYAIADATAASTASSPPAT
jgi:quinol monooxygenase YgiN